MGTSTDWDDLRNLYRPSFLIDPEYELQQWRNLYQEDKVRHPEEHAPIMLSTIRGEVPLTVALMMDTVNWRWELYP